MTDATFHTTRQDLRKAEAKLSETHGGNPPADSDISQMKVRHVFSRVAIVNPSNSRPVHHRPEPEQAEAD